MSPQHAQHLDELKAHLDGEPEVHEAAAAIELDPADPITRGLEIAIERWAQRGRHPTTFAELNRSGD